VGHEHDDHHDHRQHHHDHQDVNNAKLAASATFHCLWLFPWNEATPKSKRAFLSFFQTGAFG